MVLVANVYNISLQMYCAVHQPNNMLIVGQLMKNLAVINKVSFFQDSAYLQCSETVTLAPERLSTSA